MLRTLILFPFFACACITAAQLKPATQGVADETSNIVAALDTLDAVCQSRGHSAAELAACTEPRDRIRAALRRQLAAMASLGK